MDQGNCHRVKPASKEDMSFCRVAVPYAVLTAYCEHGVSLDAEPLPLLSP